MPNLRGGTRPLWQPWKPDLPLSVHCSARDRVAVQRYIMVPVDSWTTAAQFQEVVCARLGIKNGRSFGLYEVISSAVERGGGALATTSMCCSHVMADWS